MSETEITLKNTKVEILEALKSALKRAEMVEKTKLEPEKVMKEQAEKKAIETTQKAVEENIFSKELIDKFHNLQIAITAEENKLQELYGIGCELQKLALVIESGNERIAKIEAEELIKTKEKQDNLQALDAQFNQKKLELQFEYDEVSKKLKIDRERENEEYQYNLARKREKENNAWSDEKKARESALLKQEQDAKIMLEEAESKIEYIKSLEDKVENIGALVEKEKQAAIKAVTANLNMEFEHKSALAEKDCKNSISRLEDKVSYLEKELSVSNELVITLQNKLDKSYTELRELATKTVEFTGGVKILGNLEGK